MAIEKKKTKQKQTRKINSDNWFSDNFRFRLSLYFQIQFHFCTCHIDLINSCALHCVTRYWITESTRFEFYFFFFHWILWAFCCTLFQSAQCTLHCNGYSFLHFEFQFHCRKKINIHRYINPFIEQHWLLLFFCLFVLYFFVVYNIHANTLWLLALSFFFCFNCKSPSFVICESSEFGYLHVKLKINRRNCKSGTRNKILFCTNGELFITLIGVTENVNKKNTNSDIFCK